MSGGLAVWCLAVWCLVFGVWRLVYCIKSSSKHGSRCRLWMQIQPRGAGDGVFGVRGHGLFERGYNASSTHVTRHTSHKEQINRLICVSHRETIPHIPNMQSLRCTLSPMTWKMPVTSKRRTIQLPAANHVAHRHITAHLFAYRRARPHLRCLVVDGLGAESPSPRRPYCSKPRGRRRL